MSLVTKLKNFLFSKKFLVNLGLLVLAYILIVFVTKWYLDSYTDHGQKIEVPNLVGKNEKQIGSIVKGIGLSYEIAESIYDPSKPDGTILSQDPTPSNQSDIFVKEGRIIRVKISKKTQLIEIPSCVDKSQRFAENILKSRGFKVRIEYKPSTESAGAVIQQLYKGKPIEKNDKITIGSTITLVVGKNTLGEAMPIPNLMDLTICDVKSRLSAVADIHLMVVCDGCATSADTCAARVFSQSPEYIEGGLISGGATITVHAIKQ
jgi:beta-lactam-binding protein with PASTA domain